MDRPVCPASHRDSPMTIPAAQRYSLAISRRALSRAGFAAASIRANPTPLHCCLSSLKMLARLPNHLGSDSAEPLPLETLSLMAQTLPYLPRVSAASRPRGVKSAFSSWSRAGLRHNQVRAGSRQRSRTSRVYDRRIVRPPKRPTRADMTVVLISSHEAASELGNS